MRMVRWYADNSETKSNHEIAIPDIQLFGGIAANESVCAELVSVMKRVKTAYRRTPDFPLKWCFKDLEKDFRENRLTRSYTKLLRNWSEWRTEIFNHISQIDFRIFVSVIFSYGRSRSTLLDTKEAVTRFGFANALQRFGLFIKRLDLKPAEVILDWPDKSRKNLFDLEYKSAFQKGCSAVYGTGYRCGPLKNLGFSDSVLFTSMNQCCLLQISDMIVGACRELVEEALGRRHNSLGTRLLRLVRGRIDGAPGSAVGWGIAISPTGGDFFVKVRNKVNELFI
jgi:hypothetical protein